MSGQRLKLRHKITGEEKGPFFGWYPADWFELFATNQYDYIRSSDVLDKNGREIFAGDVVVMGDGPPMEVIEKLDKVGITTSNGFEELTEEVGIVLQVVGRDGVLTD
jgi:hypothetical protein